MAIDTSGYNHSYWSLGLFYCSSPFYSSLSSALVKWILFSLVSIDNNVSTSFFWNVTLFWLKDVYVDGGLLRC